MSGGEIPRDRPVGPDDPLYPEMILQVHFGGGFVRVAISAIGVSDHVPVQHHGIHAVELEIPALVNDVHGIHGHAEICANSHRRCIVARVGKGAKGSPPCVEDPILDAHLTVFYDVDRAVVAHPGVVVGNCMPGDLGVIGVPTRRRDGCSRLVPDRVRVVQDMEGLILHHDVRDLRIGGFVGLFKGPGPLQPERFLGFPLGRNSSALGIGHAVLTHEQKNRCTGGHSAKSPACPKKSFSQLLCKPRGEAPVVVDPPARRPSASSSSCTRSSFGFRDRPGRMSLRHRHGQKP